MACLGRVRRFFRAKTPDYYDREVAAYIVSTGGATTDYTDYCVVPQNLSHAFLSIAKYDRPSDPLTREVKLMYDKAADWMEQEFGPYVSDSLLSDCDYVVEGLTLDTSPGYPWTQTCRDKLQYMQRYGEFYEFYWCRLATDEYVRSFCAASIKEELRPVEKVVKGKVRTIIAMDVNHLIAMNVLCSDQNERLIFTVGRHSSCLGQVMQRGEWHKLHDRVSRFGSGTGLEIDGKEFDGRFHTYGMSKIKDFRFKMLRRDYRTDANRRRLDNLYKEVSTSPIVAPDGHVFARCGGNPSGHGNTGTDNTLKNFMDMCVQWQMATPVEYHTYTQFKRYVELALCGDDILAGVHPDVHHLFNRAVIMKNGPSIGMEYHCDSDYRDVCDCTFLGHGFRLCEVRPSIKMFLPVIDCERMRASMLWYNEHGTVASTIERACGLRAETFPCESCRDWFADLLCFLRDRFGASLDPTIRLAWKSYLSDSQLWSIYSGLGHDE